MIPRAQLVLSTQEQPRIGDCFRACVASILELPCAEVPNFCADQADDPDQGAWWHTFKSWLQARDLDATYYPLTGDDGYVPPGWAIAGGPSPRFAGVENPGHACVAAFGEVAWDPHPEDRGLLEVEDYIMIHGPGGAWTWHNGPDSWQPAEHRPACDHQRVRSCGHPGCGRLDCYQCDAHDVARTDRTIELTVGHYCPRHQSLWEHAPATSARLRAAREAHEARRLSILTPRERERDARGELGVVCRYPASITREVEP